MTDPTGVFNDPQPLVILIFVLGFAAAVLLNLVNWWRLLRGDLARHRDPKAPPEPVDYPAGPGLPGRSGRQETTSKSCKNSTDAGRKGYSEGS